MKCALVQNGIIANIAVFDDAELASEFGYLQVHEEQRIGEMYFEPEQYQKMVDEEYVETINEMLKTSIDEAI